MKRTSSLLFLTLLSILSLLPVSSCAPLPSRQSWTISDLRVLDPVDVAASPSTDILAVYTRTTKFDLEFRVDLLDLPLVPDYHLQILLDTIPGENAWNMVIDIPAGGRPTVIPANSNIIPRVVRDPWLDTVTVSINRRTVPRLFTFKVVSFAAGDPSSTDETISIRSDALPPLQRAPMVLMFWDVFPAATPAQALRLLDGAHTGPRGERHGLIQVLDAAGEYDIPVALLDLKTPGSLGALSYIGILAQINNLVERNLLILPDVAYGDPAYTSLGFSRQAAAGFGLPASQFVYSTSGILSDSMAQFIQLDNSTQVSISGRTKLIPLPPKDDIQATQDGPSLDVRRALVKAAFSGDPSRLVVLGGDLPLSTWGNQDMAGPTFAWLAAHPWIQALTGEGLISIPGGSIIKFPPGTSPISFYDLVGLKNAPDNSITQSAWQTYFMLTSPTTDEKLIALRSNYIGQVGELLAAANWAAHPSVNTSCDQDLNGDGKTECIISDRNFYAILNPAGARLTNLFYLDGKGPHQIVGPSSQFTIGLSDPSEWHPELGQAADPSVIPGAFSDDVQTWSAYSATISPGKIVFTSPDGSLTKTYQLSGDGVEISYQASTSITTRVPLAVDPQAFFYAPASFSGSLSKGFWIWGPINGIQVVLQTTQSLSVQSFTDSLPFLSQPENPDRDYPAGHYLPFPLSVVYIQGSGNFSVQIGIK